MNLRPHTMSLLRIILPAVIAISTAYAAEAAPARSIPSFPEAVVQIRVDGTIADSAGNHSLKQFTPSTCGLSAIRSPRYAADGGLLLTAPVAPDVKVPFFAASDYNEREYFAVALRMRLPRGLHDYAPIMLIPTNAADGAIKPFVIDGDSIRVFGAKRSNETLDWWSNPLPQPDAEGYTSIIYQRIGSVGAKLYVGDRLYDYADNVRSNARYERVVVNAADSVVLNDFVIFSQCETHKVFTAFNGYERGFSYDYGEKDEQGTITEYTERENAGYKRWIAIDIIMIVITIAIRLRRPRRHVVSFQFVGFPLLVLAIIISITVHALLYQPGGVTLEFWKWIASLAAYLVVAWTPLDQKEHDNLMEERAYEKQQRRGKSMKGRIGSLLGMLALGSFLYTMSAYESSKRRVVTVDTATGQRTGSRTTHDMGSFFSQIMAAAVVVFSVIAILGFFVFLLMRILLWILPWIPVLLFIVNTAIYIVIERNIDHSKDPV